MEPCHILLQSSMADFVSCDQLLQKSWPIWNATFVRMLKYLGGIDIDAYQDIKLRREVQ